MGSGHFSDHEFIHSGYVRQIRYVNSRNLVMDFDPNVTATHVDVPLCYNVFDEGHRVGDAAYSTTFGGPGGNCD